MMRNYIDILNESIESDVASDLNDILEQMVDLLSQAEDLVRSTSEGRAAESYWIPHIKQALGTEPGSMNSMMDTIEALQNSDEEDEDDGSMEYAARINGLK